MTIHQSAYASARAKDPSLVSVKPVDPSPDVKVLIACNSCWKDIENGGNEAIRDTWAKSLPEGVDLKFFVGDRNFTQKEEETLFTNDFLGSPGTLGNLAPATAKKATIGEAKDLQSDEVMLEDVPDGYLGMPWKTVRSLEWAKDYDFVFRIFTDTYVFPDRLMRSGFEQFDALGIVVFGCPPCAAHPDLMHACPLGGDGYWTSRKASKAIIDEPIKHWGEDTHAGHALQQAGITIFHDWKFRYSSHREAQYNRTALSIHLNDRGTGWNPALMVQTHKIQEHARTMFPTWDGTCKRCESDKFAIHPLGPRCADCGQRV